MRHLIVIVVLLGALFTVHASCYAQSTMYHSATGPEWVSDEYPEAELAVNSMASSIREYYRQRISNRRYYMVSADGDVMDSHYDPPKFWQSVTLLEHNYQHISPHSSRTFDTPWEEIAYLREENGRLAMPVSSLDSDFEFPVIDLSVRLIDAMIIAGCPLFSLLGAVTFCLTGGYTSMSKMAKTLPIAVVTGLLFGLYFFGSSEANFNALSRIFIAASLFGYQAELFWKIQSSKVRELMQNKINAEVDNL